MVKSKIKIYKDCFGFLCLMSNAGPGGPKDRGYKSIHICNFPCKATEIVNKINN